MLKLEKNKNLKLVQVLRGVASLLVVLFHMTRNVNEIYNEKFLFDFFEFGASGVDIFFVLSGFIIMFVNADKIGNYKNFWIFIKKRFVRIYPIYWIVITIFLLLQLLLPQFYRTHFDLNFLNIINTYLLLPNHEMLNGVSWTLTNELFFYLLFAFTILIPGKKIHIVLFVSYFLLLLILPFFSADLSNINPYQNLVFFPMNIEFLLGVLIALIVKKVKPIIIKPALVTGILLFFVGIWLANNKIQVFENGFSETCNRVLYFGISSFLIVLAIVKMELLRNINVDKILLYLGDASYSIYLIHLPIVAAFYKILKILGIQNPILFYGLSVILFMFICATGIFIYEKLEKPIIKFLNKKL